MPQADRSFNKCLAHAGPFFILRCVLAPVRMVSSLADAGGVVTRGACFGLGSTRSRTRPAG